MVKAGACINHVDPATGRSVVLGQHVAGCGASNPKVEMGEATQSPRELSPNAELDLEIQL